MLGLDPLDLCFGALRPDGLVPPDVAAGHERRVGLGRGVVVGVHEHALDGVAVARRDLDRLVRNCLFFFEVFCFVCFLGGGV